MEDKLVHRDRGSSSTETLQVIEFKCKKITNISLEDEVK